MTISSQALRHALCGIIFECSGISKRCLLASPATADHVFYIDGQSMRAAYGPQGSCTLPLTPRIQVAAPMQFVPHETSTNVVAGIKRPRSNTAGSTSSSRRTKSRASTTSLVSSSNQSLCHHRQSTEQPHGTPVQRGPSQPYQYTAEEMITRSEQQLTNPNLAYTFEPSLGRPGEHPGNTYTHERGTRPRQDANIDPAIQRPSLYPHHSYEGDSYAFEHVNGEQGIGDNGPSDGRKKKGNASSIANDLELKKLFRDNAGRSLKEVAAQILANERGPRSEKTKQIFAMLW